MDIIGMTEGIEDIRRSGKQIFEEAVESEAF